MQNVRKHSFLRLPDRGQEIQTLGREEPEVRHKVKISVSDKPKTGGLITCRDITVRDRLMRFLFGDRRRVTVLIPGDSVEEIAICEDEEGGENSGEGKVHA
jgi:hypothetical protein